MADHIQLHHDAAWLKAGIDAGKTSRDLAREARVSYHLIEIKLKEAGIKFTSQVPSLAV